MLGETVKALRKNRAWSQAHLAVAAGVSVRTIQRVEREGQCADETLLSIAAALDIDVQRLTSAKPSPAAPLVPHDHTGTRYLWPALDPKKAARWGGVLAIPGLLFVVSNVLKFNLEFPYLYDGLAHLAETTKLAHFEDLLLSPALLFGGPLLSVLMNLYALVRARGDRHEKKIFIVDVEVSLYRASVFALAGSLACVVVLLGYVTIENVAEWIVNMINS